MDTLDPVDVAIVGAGPYGLAIASHLGQLGVPYRIFGEPMRFWRAMPQQLFLKSFAFATTIDNPQNLTFKAWCTERKLEDREPCSVESFVQYGEWLQKKLVPNVEPVDVKHVEQLPSGGFGLTLENGQRLTAKRVVMAVGLTYFRRLPQVLKGLPSSLVTHTSERADRDKFAGKSVAVVGAGASAMEAATLLHEAGARVQLIVRNTQTIFHDQTPKERPLLDRIRAPLSVVGADRIGWTLQHFPLLPFYAPDSFRVKLTKRFLGPSGSWWLKPRFEGKFPVNLRTDIASARPDGDGVTLRLTQAGQGERDLHVDHVVCGTGFQVDIDRLSILDEKVRKSLARIESAPRLNLNFESNVPGLFFVGAMSTFSFGPLFRFVTGTAFTAPRISRHLKRTYKPERNPMPAQVRGAA
jgi:FAD-dependent urate hydroxylase